MRKCIVLTLKRLMSRWPQCSHNMGPSPFVSPIALFLLQKKNNSLSLYYYDYRVYVFWMCLCAISILNKLVTRLQFYFCSCTSVSNLFIAPYVSNIYEYFLLGVYLWSDMIRFSSENKGKQKNPPKTAQTNTIKVEISGCAFFLFVVWI